MAGRRNGSEAGRPQIQGRILLLGTHLHALPAAVHGEGQPDQADRPGLCRQHRRQKGVRLPWRELLLPQQIWRGHVEPEGRRVRGDRDREKNRLGIPLPKGTVRVYKQDSSGSLQFVGEDSIDHTAKDEKVHVKLGDAFDVVGSRSRRTGRRSPTTPTRLPSRSPSGTTRRRT